MWHITFFYFSLFNLNLPTSATDLKKLWSIKLWRRLTLEPKPVIRSQGLGSKYLVRLLSVFHLKAVIDNTIFVPSSIHSITISGSVTTFDLPTQKRNQIIRSQCHTVPGHRGVLFTSNFCTLRADVQCIRHDLSRRFRVHAVIGQMLCRPYFINIYN